MLQKLIQTRGVKQKWLAQQIGVSEVTMSNWMRGIYKPSEENLIKMAEVLNLDLQLLKEAVHEI